MVQAFNLDVTPGGLPPIIHVSQYDDKLRNLVITLTENGAPYAAPAGATAEIRGTKSDKYGFSYAAELTGNTITATVTRQMTVCAGPVMAEIVLIKDGGVLGTANFVIDVERAALADETIQSGDDFKTLVRYVQDAENAAESAEKSADGAAKSMDAANDAASDSAEARRVAELAAGTATEKAAEAVDSMQEAAAAKNAAQLAAGQAGSCAAAAAESEEKAAEYAARATGAGGGILFFMDAADGGLNATVDD